MPTKRYRLLVTFSPEEKAQLDALSSQLRLPKADLLRRLMMAERLPRPEEFVASQSIRDLLRVNADQARLGNLLKLAVDEIEPPARLLAALERLASEIAATQEILKATARDIRAQVPRSRS